MVLLFFLVINFIISLYILAINFQVWSMVDKDYFLLSRWSLHSACFFFCAETLYEIPFVRSCYCLLSYWRFFSEVFAYPCILKNFPLGSFKACVLHCFFFFFVRGRKCGSCFILPCIDTWFYQYNLLKKPSPLIHIYYWDHCWKLGGCSCVGLFIYLFLCSAGLHICVGATTILCVLFSVCSKFEVSYCAISSIAPST